MAFSFVYELFSHEVYSSYMMGLFAVPLLLGVVPSIVLGRTNIRVGWLARQLWASAVLTLTLGCCLLGVVEIYGTTSPYAPLYGIVGAVLALSSMVSVAFSAR